MERNRHRTVTESHPLMKLPDLVRDVQDSLTEGGPVIDGAPIPLVYREAVRFLSHRNYLRSSRYKDQWWRADTSGLDPDVFEYVQGFRRQMENIGIPVVPDVVATSADAQRWFVFELEDEAPSTLTPGRSFAMRHALRGHTMPEICWRIFGHVGREVAGKLGVDVRWGGHTCPWRWDVL